jgi:hypothetical protein
MFAGSGIPTCKFRKTLLQGREKLKSFSSLEFAAGRPRSRQIACANSSTDAALFEMKFGSNR